MEQCLLNYLTSLMPDALINCDGCTRQVKASEAIKREGKHFHSEQCADIACARFVKHQPARVEGVNHCDGWDI
jgi:hypothetical protein